MNENLIPQVILDLVEKFRKCNDINEKYNLRNRLCDIIAFVEVAVREEDRKKKK